MTLNYLVVHELKQFAVRIFCQLQTVRFQGQFHLPEQLTINVLGQLTAICAAWSRKAIPHCSCLVFIVLIMYRAVASYVTIVNQLYISLLILGYLRYLLRLCCKRVVFGRGLFQAY